MKNSVSELQKKLEDESLESYENIEVNVSVLRKVFANCHHLFKALDNIDTAEDMTKGDMDSFFKIAHDLHRVRFDVADTDGYKVVFK